MPNRGQLIDEIVDFIKPKYKIEKVEVEYKSKPNGEKPTSMYTRINFNEGIATIRYPKKYDIFNDSYYKCFYERFGSFIEIAGYELSNENYDVITILHELGHVNYVSKMDSMDSINLMIAVDSHSKDMINLAFNENDIKDHEEEGIDIRYMNIAAEMYADYFAVKHFIPTMKYLKENKIL